MVILDYKIKRKNYLEPVLNKYKKTLYQAWLFRLGSAVRPWLSYPTSHNASSVLEKLIFKGFYHIWAWQPSWSMDGNYVSNLLFPCPREAQKKSNTGPEAPKVKLFEILNIFPIHMHREANLTSP